MVRLVTNVATDIPVSELLDGQLAVITAWIGDKYIGEVVQRNGAGLVAIGQPTGAGWSLIYPDCSRYQQCRVRRLVPGDQLVVEGQ